MTESLPSHIVGCLLFFDFVVCPAVTKNGSAVVTKQGLSVEEGISDEEGLSCCDQGLSVEEGLSLLPGWVFEKVCLASANNVQATRWV